MLVVGKHLVIALLKKLFVFSFQGMFCMETIMKHLAEEFNLDVDQVSNFENLKVILNFKFREENMYTEAQMTPCGMVLYKVKVKPRLKIMKFVREKFLV